MAASVEETPIDRKLEDIFEEAYNLYNGFDDCVDPTNSPDFQRKIKKSIGLFEEATKLVSLTGLFSSNEEYEEIATDHLKYLLLPYFLGQLTLKICSTDRRNIVEVSEVYFRDFLKRCIEYGLTATNTETALAQVERQPNSEVAALIAMSRQRNTKIEQYRIKKELDDQIKQIKIVMEREHIDDDLKRDFYIKLIKSSIMNSVDEISSVEQEKQILDHMSKLRHDDPDSDRPKPVRRPTQPLRPIIITKDEVQKAVYGLGYPSMPTMTVDEFYTQRVADGVFPDPTVVRDPNSLQMRAMRGETTELDEQEEVKKEEDIENDDEEYLARQRAMDEFKDDVRRGDGNRYNRS
ncbi:hypothetical protein HA402_014230 [Bradysia odoriphaga]|nr:hypothetical protein HA402_014230 [Bradysia odoriphaga]